MTHTPGKDLDFESFDSFFAGLTMAQEKDAMALYEQYLKSHITSILSSLADEVEKDAGCACSSNMCGHQNIDPNSANHGEYVGRDIALREAAQIIRSYMQKS